MYIVQKFKEYYAIMRKNTIPSFPNGCLPTSVIPYFLNAEAPFSSLSTISSKSSVVTSIFINSSLILTFLYLTVLDNTSDFLFQKKEDLALLNQHSTFLP